MTVLGIQYADFVRSIVVAMQKSYDAGKKVTKRQLARAAGCNTEQVEECLKQDYTLRYLFEATHSREFRASAH